MAVLGSSISTWGRGPMMADQTWHGMLHRWLELTFSPCGERMEAGHSVRERDKAYNGSVGSRRTCSQSTIEYVDLALGSTSSIWAEKCMLGPDTVRLRLEESVISQQIDHPEQASIYLDLGRATSRRMRLSFFRCPSACHDVCPSYHHARRSCPPMWISSSSTTPPRPHTEER